MKNKKLLTIDLDWIQHPRQFTDILPICVKIFKKQTPTIFIKSHQEIYDHIEPESIVINIDHHHDFGYDQVSVKEALENIPREGNWVLAAAIHKKIKGYIWVKNYDSKINASEITDWIRNLDFFKIKNDIKDCDFENIYKLVVCESVEYEKNVSFYSQVLREVCKNINTNTQIVDNKNPFKRINT